MSESILKAIIKLFALVAKIETVANSSRQLVESFLYEQLNEESAIEYLKLYDDIIAQDEKVAEGDQKLKRRSLSGVKVLAICEQLNTSLTQRQKVIVVLRLIEIILATQQATDDERDFVDTVANSFNIDEDEYLRCIIYFNSQATDELTEENHFLIIDNSIKQSIDRKHLYNEHINGHIRIMFIKSVSMYVLRYFGNSEITLNGHQISYGKIYILNQGVSIRSPKFSPIFYSDIVSCFLTTDTKQKIVFEAQKLGYEFSNGKIGLHNLSISETSGKLVGIMGGSGAGKSTLLNILNGNDKPTVGNVFINGINFHTEKQKLKGIVGHISQDDLLMESLTVYENLFYNAKLCFSYLSDDEINDKCLRLLAEIGLYEAKDLKVGNVLSKTISGGQRKRLNIALELIREPSILFVDEPTSGLSSRDSENIMDLLKELALKGKLVFVVIHQPSSDIFKMFDKLLLLDVGGYPIYYGNPVEAVIYFKNVVSHINANESECMVCGNVNPEQIFNIIEAQVLDEYGNNTQKRKISPAQWNKYFVQNHHAENIDSKNSELPPGIFQIPTKWQQFKVFLKRDVLSKLSNKQYMLINLLEAPVLALILAFLVRYINPKSETGYVFADNMNIPAYMFMSVIVALFLGLSVSAEEIIADRKIRKRESFLSLSKSSYLWSKIVLMFTFSAIQALFFVLIGNSILEIRDMYFQYWLVLFTTSCFANMLGLNISATFNSAVTIYILIPFLLIPQLLLSGLIVKFENLHPSLSSKSEVPFAGKIMTSFWAYEALAVNQFTNNAYEKYFYNVDKHASFATFKLNFWLDAMRTKLDDAEALLNEKNNETKLANALLTLKNELEDESRLSEIKFTKMNLLNAHSFDKKTLIALRKHFDELEEFYRDKNLQASKEKQRIVKQLAPNQASEKAFAIWKQNNENLAVADAVKNVAHEERIEEIDNHFIQLSDNIFNLPPQSNFLNAHFYAPEKPVFGSYFDTFDINVFVIWVMSFLLSITLYFNAFANAFKAMGNLFTGWRYTKKPKKYL